MHGYLRTFLACVPTQLVKAFGIKWLNFYCLVRNRVAPPAETQKLLGWVGVSVWGGRGRDSAILRPRHSSLKTDLGSALNRAARRLPLAFFSLPFGCFSCVCLHTKSIIPGVSPPLPPPTTGAGRQQKGAVGTLTVHGHKSQVELRGCRSAQVEC